jgi:hypothetical protein
MFIYLKRNQLMNNILKDEISLIHSITFKLLTPNKWEELQPKDNQNTRNIFRVPPCMNKNKK